MGLQLIMTIASSQGTKGQACIFEKCVIAGVVVKYDKHVASAAHHTQEIGF
jgi:hypothetical protein